MNYRNARYISASGIVDCEIEHPVYGWVPYTITPNDTDTTINNEDLLSVMLENGDVAAYIPPTQAELDEQAADAIRAERDMKLTTEVDPIAGNALRWAALTAEQQQSWADYRQSLLDISQQSGFPYEVLWPVKPI